ncbi:MAG: site-specific integrase [Armatimonadetes bacterium]|nr:site-specific integrase [Armatimonadota bacterium]
MENTLPKKLQALKVSNENFTVKLRFRRTNVSSPYLLYLDFTHKKKRQTKSLGISIFGDQKNKKSDEDAIDVALETQLQFNKECKKDPDNFSFTRTDEKNFINFFKTTADKKSDKNYRLAYNKFIDFFADENLEIRNIKFALCEDFKDYLLDLKISDHTAKHYFTCFKGCLNYAVKRDLIDKNPAKEISIRFQRKSIERLIETEIQKLWYTPCSYHDLKNGFLFSCFTGLRFSDIINLKFSDIDNGKIKVMQKKTLNEVEIPLYSIAEKILIMQRNKSKDDQVFHIPSGGKTSQELKQWLAKADINKHITFHCSRHTFGCLLVENDVSLFVVKKLMGHRKIETTLHYVDKANVDAEAAINSLPQINIEK